MSILRRNNVLAIVLSLFVIGTAFLLIVQYEKGMVILENKWWPSYDIRKENSFLGRSPVIKDQPKDPTRYSIKIYLKGALNERGDSLEIRFCDKYSFILAGSNLPSGVYCYKVDNSMKEYASKINYKDVIARKEIVAPRFKKINLYLECDLIEKIASIYIDGKFIEKIYLGPEARHYAINLSLNLRNFILDNVEIFDCVGKKLFSANYRLLFFYKIISQILISFGVLIFFALAYSERCFLKRSLYLGLILLCIEGFLRIGERYNQNFNILFPKWRFETSTNLYGTYNNPKNIKITTYPDVNPKIYQIPKPEDTRRIICMGTSPIVGAMLPDPAQQAFPVLLYKKINQRNKLRNDVINAGLLTERYIDGLETNIYLKQVLFKLEPDLILFYMKWSPQQKYLLESHVLYDRAKKIMEMNSSWIRNDRLLYAALEFKKPIKEIVYLYDFLCKSYLFMGLENTRKRVFNRLYCISREPSIERPGSYFNETLRLCREKKIKLLLIPQFDFFNFQSDLRTIKEIKRILSENPEVYCLDLERAFSENKNFILAYDGSHPTEYGHMVIAEEVFRKLTQEGLISINEGL